MLDANFAKNRQIFGALLQFVWCTMQMKSDVFGRQTLKQINHYAEIFTVIANDHLRTILELNKQNLL